MRGAIALILLLLGSPALADVVSIRSGQHDRFSRLVLAIPEGRDWALGRTTDGYALELGDGEDRFDTSTVFDRIPANRIASLSDEQGRLRIDLACDCHADAFLWQTDRLVIDIIDGPPPEGSGFEVAFAEPTVEEPPTTQMRSGLPLLVPRAEDVAGLPFVPGTFSQSPPTDDRVADAERAIIESLARAASQGVFSVPSSVVPIIPDNLSEEGETPPARFPYLTPVTDPMDGVPVPLPGPQGTDGPGLILRTGIERSADGEAVTSEAGGLCLSDDMLSIDTWGDERDFSAQIADHRRILTGEFDVIPEGSIEALAKTYLYFGFGQEARQVLALDGKMTQERRVLEALSRVVDDAPQGTTVLTGQIECPGFVAMWAALANDNFEGATQDGRDAAVMAFRLLPDDLRGHLGARLAQLFLDAGDPDTADLVLTAAQQLESGTTVEAELTSAAMIETTEGTGPAIEALGVMAEGNTRMTADGLVRLIDLLIAEGDGVDEAILGLAAAMRFEAGTSEDARLLGLAEVRARTAQNAFDAALELVVDPDTPFGEMDRAEQYSAVLLAMAERAETPAFLTMAFNGLPAGLSAAAENAVAARLLAVGFPERAAAILSGPAAAEDMAERRYLRAEAAAALGDIAGLDAALVGLTDARASQIRSAAFAASGDFETALAEEIQGSATLPDPENAWRAGAWTLLETGEDPLLQEASRAILTEPSPLPTPPTLAARRDLLEEARATRALTEELLGRFSLEGAQVDAE